MQDARTDHVGTFIHGGMFVEIHDVRNVMESLLVTSHEFTMSEEEGSFAPIITAPINSNGTIIRFKCNLIYLKFTRHKVYKYIHSGDKGTLFHSIGS